MSMEGKRSHAERAAEQKEHSSVILFEPNAPAGGSPKTRAPHAGTGGPTGRGKSQENRMWRGEKHKSTMAAVALI